MRTKFRELLFSVLILCLVSCLILPCTSYAFWQRRRPRIEEVDGSPSGAPSVWKQPNGTVTDNADGSFTYTPSEDFTDLTADTLAVSGTATISSDLTISGTTANLYLSETTSHLRLPSNNDAATPTIAFGDGDTGLFESQDEWIDFTFGGTSAFAITSSALLSRTAFGARLAWGAATTTIPAFCFSVDENTGIGRAGADQLSLIANATEIIRVKTTGIDITGDASISTDLTISGGTYATGTTGAGLVIPTAVPSSPTNGSMYYDDTGNKLYIYDGSAWDYATFTDG